MLLLLAVASGILAVVASNNAEEARTQARNARSLGLASESSSATGQDAPQALALALASRGQATTDIGHRALQTAVASPIWRVYGPAVRQSSAAPAPTMMSPKGRLVAAGNAGDGVRVWDSREGAHDTTLLAPGTITASSLAFAPDEQRLAATFITKPAKGSDNLGGRLVIWQRPDKRPLIERDTASALVAVAYAPDGGTVAAGDFDGNVRLWDADGNNARVVATGFPSVTTVSFSPDSRFVAATTAGDDGADTTTGNVVVIDTASAERVVIPVGSADVNAGAYSSDGKTFFTGDGDGNVRSWDLASGAPLKSWTDSGPVQSITVSPVAPLVVSGDENGEVVVRDSATGLERATWNEGTLVTSVTFDRTGGRLETGNDRGRITIRETSLLPNVFDTGRAVKSLAMSADGDIISYSPPAQTGSTAGGELKILHRATNNSQRLVDGARPSIVTVNPEGTFAAFAEAQPEVDGTHVEVTTVDLATRQVVASWNVDGTLVDLFLQDETTLTGVVKRDDEDHLMSWDLNGKEPTDDALGQLAVTDATQTVGSHVAFAGSNLFIVDAEQGIIVYGLDAKKPYTLDGRGTTTYGIVVSRDGTKVAAFVSERGRSAPTEVDIWDLRHKTVVPVSTNTRGATPTVAAFTHDGTKLAVGDDKSRVTLYDLADLHEITEWDLGSEVTSVAFSPKGKTLAAADNDGHIEAWGSSSWQSSDAALAAQLCRRLAGYHPIPADWAAVDPYSGYETLCPRRN
jgi:WD40 repeat protein